MDGWMDWWMRLGIKSVLQISSYFLHIKAMCISTYLYIYSKVVKKIVMGSRIWCEVGEWGSWISKLQYSRVFSNFWFQTCHFFFSMIAWCLRMDGWMDGLMDGTGYKKCPSNFFILSTYIGHVYIYVYVYLKVVKNIVMGFKIWCQVGEWALWISKLPYSREFSNFWFQTCHFVFLWSFGVLKFIQFLENLKNLHCRSKLKTYETKPGIT